MNGPASSAPVAAPPAGVPPSVVAPASGAAPPAAASHVAAPPVAPPAGASHAAAPPVAHDRPLAHLMPGWFAIVMGWAGLALAWHRSEFATGTLGAALTGLAGAVAAVAFGLLCVASLVRAVRHPRALREDLGHPIRRGFVAAVPIGLLLLVTLGVALLGPAAPGLLALWTIASAAQLAITAWVLSRWLAPPAPPARGFAWAGVTPVLFIPVVGNVLVPLAGVPLGMGTWSLAQFGAGLAFWPVVLVLLLVRLGQAGPLPERLLPAWFVPIAPPAVIGLGALSFGAPVALGWLAWGVAAFTLAWVAGTVPRIARLAFGIPHWATSFPMAALAALTLRLSQTPGGAWLEAPGLALLAIATALVAWLSAATLAGLARGTLLVPEPAPAPAPAAAAAAAK
jgi:tellurite resistance protein